MIHLARNVKLWVALVRLRRIRQCLCAFDIVRPLAGPPEADQCHPTSLTLFPARKAHNFQVGCHAHGFALCSTHILIWAFELRWRRLCRSAKVSCYGSGDIVGYGDCAKARHTARRCPRQLGAFGGNLPHATTEEFFARTTRTAFDSSFQIDFPGTQIHRGLNPSYAALADIN